MFIVSTDKEGDRAGDVRLLKPPVGCSRILCVARWRCPRAYGTTITSLERVNPWRSPSIKLTASRPHHSRNASIRSKRTALYSAFGRGPKHVRPAVLRSPIERRSRSIPSPPHPTPGSRSGQRASCCSPRRLLLVIVASAAAAVTVLTPTAQTPARGVTVTESRPTVRQCPGGRGPTQLFSITRLRGAT
jgi:hypothetical protein